MAVTISQPEALVSDISNSQPIQLIQEPLNLFGGVNSIRMVSEKSSLGLLYSTQENAFPPSLYTDFTQVQASLDIKNRQGTVVHRTQLVTSTKFLVQLEQIIEFDTGSNSSRFSSTKLPVIKKRIDLSRVRFHLKTTGSNENESNSFLTYQLVASASDIPYSGALPLTHKLDSLNMSLDFMVEKSITSISEVPQITFQQEDSQITVTRNISSQTLEAVRFAPQLKFSCNISGWDFSTPTSKLLLKVRFIAHEEIIGLKRILSNVNINRENLMQTRLLGNLKFSTEVNGDSRSHVLEQTNAQTINYTNRQFYGSRFSFGSEVRDFLNFTWIQDVMVDNRTDQVVFQPLSSGRHQFGFWPSLEPILFLNGGFIFPQGDHIAYDPELQIEELNPILNILPAPNRIIMENSSLLVIVSGFFVGIFIIIRQKVNR
jgi:hypothetical protein